MIIKKTRKIKGFLGHKGLSFLNSLIFQIFIIFLTLPISPFSETPPLYQKGYTEYNRHQFDSALVSFSQIFNQYPQSKEACYNCGLCLFKLNRLAEAISCFDTCLSIDSAFSEARFMKIRTLQETGDLKQAAEEIKKPDTKYTGYNLLKKRILYYKLAVLLSNNWYYMIAIMFIVILLFAVLAKSYYLKK